MIEDAMVNVALDAWAKNGETRYQGFFYSGKNHVIRDLSKPYDQQVVWKKEGRGDKYDFTHEEMMAELKRIRMRAALQAALAWERSRVKPPLADAPNVDLFPTDGQIGPR